MWLGRRIQTGIALHAAVNLAFGAVAVMGALGGATAANGGGAPARSATSPPWTSPLHATHPLLAATPVLFAAPEAAGDTDAGARRVVSTGYCLEGITASGRPVAPGMVAMNGVDLGTRWVVRSGPSAGMTYEVTDRIGRGTEFDIWFDDCRDARTYGRRTITVELAG